MIPELLVLGACVTKKGCSETAGQYEIYYPQVPINIRRELQPIEELVPPLMRRFAVPAAYFYANGQGSITLTARTSLLASKELTVLMWRFEW